MATAAAPRRLNTWPLNWSVRYERTGRALPAMALTTDSSILTAVANDYGYDRVFERQNRRAGASRRRGDRPQHERPIEERLARSSGRNAAGCATAALLGKGGGPARRLAEMSIVVPSSRTPLIQEAHDIIMHVVCEAIDRRRPVHEPFSSPASRHPLLIVGDIICDHYVWGNVERISPEAPVQVLRWEREADRPGGAANVAMNLAALGCKVHSCRRRRERRPGTMAAESLASARHRYPNGDRVPSTGRPRPRHASSPADNTCCASIAKRVRRSTQSPSDGSSRQSRS